MNTIHKDLQHHLNSMTPWNGGRGITDWRRKQKQFRFRSTVGHYLDWVLYRTKE